MRKQLLFAFVVLLVVQNATATRNMRRSNDLQKTSTKNNAKVTNQNQVQEDDVMVGLPAPEQFVEDPEDAPNMGGMGSINPALEPEHFCPVDFDYAEAVGGLCDQIHDLKESVENNKVELVSLTDGRCTANMLFIEALKEHKIAIDIVGQLVEMSANFEVMADSPAAFAQTDAFQRFQTNLIAISMTQDKAATEIVNKIFDKMSMLEMPKQSEIYDLMHQTSGQMKTFGSLLKEMNNAPQNLHKVLAHLNMKTGSEAQNTASEDVLSYNDLDFETFEHPEMEEVQRVEFTPLDMDQLRGDLGGLLGALRTHLEESMEDLIEREIAAAMAFADWRYDMEEEAFYFEDNLNGLIEDVKMMRQQEMACVPDEELSELPEGVEGLF